MKNYGFSLIELVLVLGIIILIAIFSYPNYRQYLTRARRIDGQTALIALASRMEDYYSRQHSYIGATLATGADTDVQSNSCSAENWYRLKIAKQTDSEYYLEATPIQAQAKEDKECQILSLDHLGIKGSRGNRIDSSLRDPCW